MISDSTNKLMPNFLGIGAARSGTTWVWNNLGQHPDIWLPRTKEKHFFDLQLTNTCLNNSFKFNLMKAKYCLYFIRAKLTKKITGEFTPAYAILPPKKIKIIKQWIPDVKLILILRDPVNRSWSSVKRHLRIENKCLDDAKTEEINNILASEPVDKRSDYRGCLKNWLNFFEREQLFVCFTRQIKDSPGDILQKMFGHLGLSTDIDLDSSTLKSRPHKTPEKEIPPEILSYLQNRYYSQKSQLENILGKKIPWG